MYSQLFCGTLEIKTEVFSHKKEESSSIKLYKIELSKYQAAVSVLNDLLTTSEHNRAERFHFLKDKNRFVICRMLLKLILAEHIGLKFYSIKLDVDLNKKPYLPSHPSVYFNLSHSEDYAIIAVANSAVGVDVEFINKEFDYKEIMPTVFNQDEISEISKCHDEHKSFYKFWTRKESIVKAIGKGIDDDLIKIPVTDGIHTLPKSLVDNFKNINVLSFKLNDEYVAAVALCGDISDNDTISFHPIPIPEELKLIFA